jgi:catechol 2,3-dioxygenase-like lactoylglutathione lyase family enzyme
VRPRHLSHVLLFTPDVDRQVAFYRDVLGLRLSDRSADIIAFMHGAHASDHHLVAFAKSDAPGYHHSSWDVASLDDVGVGAESMKARGYAHGWGVGRHVLGSNYFYYVQDPWGSWAEYSHGIDFVPADVEWPAADHAPEDSFYLWGPPPPEDFVINREQAV